MEREAILAFLLLRLPSLESVELVSGSWLLDSSNSTDCVCVCVCGCVCVCVHVRKIMLRLLTLPENAQNRFQWSYVLSL